MIYHGRARNPVMEVILHCSATPFSWARGKTIMEMHDAINQWHLARWPSGFGYHRLFAPDGQMSVGRSIYDPGVHVRGHNSRGTIALCMVGPGSPIGAPEDHYTDVQIARVKSYIAELCELTEITKVSGHNDYANKDCPGFKVISKEWLP